MTALCRSLSLPPTQKAVLMALADYCHDDGKDWHSIAALMEWTCLGKTTVIDALKGLEVAGLIRVDRRIGARSTTFLQLDTLASMSQDQCATRTGAPAVPVQEAHRHQNASRTGPKGEPVRVADTTGAAGVQTGAPPVQTGAGGAPEALEASEKHQGKHQETRARALPCPSDVDPQVWSDWLQLRKQKKAAVTETVVESARKEAAKAALTFERFLEVWCLRGSQGLMAEWLKPHERGNGQRDHVADREAVKAEAARLLGFASTSKADRIAHANAEVARRYLQRTGS